MTGTVRVPSISKTTPLRRALRGMAMELTELTEVEVAINKRGDFGWTKQMALERTNCMALDFVFWPSSSDSAGHLSFCRSKSCKSVMSEKYG